MDMNRQMLSRAVLIIMGPKDKTVFVRNPERQNSKWKFVGGKIEIGESPRQAVCRETREESGLQISKTLHDPFLIPGEYYHPRKGYRIHFFITQVDSFDGLSPTRPSGEVTLLYPIGRILNNVDEELLGGYPIFEPHVDALNRWFQQGKRDGKTSLFGMPGKKENLVPILQGLQGTW